MDSAFRTSRPDVDRYQNPADLGRILRGRFHALHLRHFKRMDTAGAGLVGFRHSALADVVGGDGLSSEAVDRK